MRDYSKSRIYQLIDLGTNDVYIGSTTRRLSERLGGHVGKYKLYLDGRYNYVTSFEIIKNGNYKIELIEVYPCENNKQLLEREGHFIKNIACINKHVAGRSKKDSQKNWVDNNKEYFKEYREKHKEKLKEHYSKRYECECGGRYTRANKSQHIKSKKHQKYMVA